MRSLMLAGSSGAQRARPIGARRLPTLARFCRGAVSRLRLSAEAL
jgi:hypothetical protein